MPDNFESMLAMYQAEDTLSVVLPLPVQQEIEILNRKTNAAVFEAGIIRGPEQLLYGDKTCSGSMTPDDDAPVQERSTCPYYYVISHDPLRYPVAIAEARCKCMYCLDDSTGDNLCEAVYFPKTVLRRQGGCVNGTYVYQPEMYYVQNACVCAKRRFAMSPTSEKGGGRSNTETGGDQDRGSQNSATTTAATMFTFA